MEIDGETNIAIEKDAQFTPDVAIETFRLHAVAVDLVLLVTMRRVLRRMYICLIMTGSGVAALAGSLRAIRQRHVGSGIMRSFEIMLDMLLMGAISGAAFGMVLKLLAQSDLQSLMNYAGRDRTAADPAAAARCRPLAVEARGAAHPHGLLLSNWYRRVAEGAPCAVAEACRGGVALYLAPCMMPPRRGRASPSFRMGLSGSGA